MSDDNGGIRAVMISGMHHDLLVRLKTRIGMNASPTSKVLERLIREAAERAGLLDERAGTES